MKLWFVFSLWVFIFYKSFDNYGKCIFFFLSENNLLIIINMYNTYEFNLGSLWIQPGLYLICYPLCKIYIHGWELLSYIIIYLVCVKF